MDSFHNLRTHKEPTPNKFTIAMGEMIIRKVRIEAKLTQAELAERANFNQTAISLIEQEKGVVSAAEVLYFSAALDNHIMHFFQPFVDVYSKEIELSSLEIELVNQAKKLAKTN